MRTATLLPSSLRRNGSAVTFRMARSMLSRASCVSSNSRWMSETSWVYSYKRKFSCLIVSFY